MTNFENPNLGRAKIYEDADIFQIRIKSKASLFVTLFLSFWLCGWAFGEIVVIGTLLSGKAGGGTLFFLAWLGGWTVGGLFALSQVLWNVAGYELLSLSKNALTLQRHIPFYRRSWSYDIEHINNVRWNPDGSNETIFSGKQGLHGLFSKRNAGAIKFDYGLQTPGFGIDLEEAEARMLAEKLSTRLGAD